MHVWKYVHAYAHTQCGALSVKPIPHNVRMAFIKAIRTNPFPSMYMMLACTYGLYMMLACAYGLYKVHMMLACAYGLYP